MPLELHHRVALSDPHAHLVDVEVTVRSLAPLPEPLVLFMPVWTPGSYLVREHARNVEAMRCASNARVTKVRKNAWRVDHAGAHEVRVSYRLYCGEHSVRTNHVDATHAFFNGAATFLSVEGYERATCTVGIGAPSGWRTATALPAAGDGTFVAEHSDALYDTPFEIGQHREQSAEVLGKRLRLAVWPGDALDDGNAGRLLADARHILRTEARLFEDELPFDDYLLLAHVQPRVRGGLEHASSAVVLVSPTAFRSREGYLDVLSLVAHELLHAWNVKRVRPAAFTPYRYQEECYTRLLWWFEGATSYYDWLLLRRAGLCSEAEYLDHIAREIGTLDATPGRLVQSLEEASFDAWIKAYRPDENSTNSSVSYYRKGELACMVLDLEIRARSGGAKCLDDVLLHMWRAHGRTGEGVGEDGMVTLMEAATGLALGELHDALVRTATEIDFATPLASAGLALERDVRGSGAPSIGARLVGDGEQIRVRSVVRGGAAQRAGVDAGDEVIAIAGRRLTSTSVDAALHGLAAGDPVEVFVARDGRTRALGLVLDPPRADRFRIHEREEASEAQRALLRSWLRTETTPTSRSA